MLLLLGYRADAILDHVGNGDAWGLAVSAVVTDPDDETSSRMLAARDRLDDRFLFLYSDNYWPLQMERLWADYERLGRPAIVTVYRNLDGYTRSNVRLADGAVVEYDPTRSRPGLGGVEIGYAILPSDVVDLIDRTDRPFEKVVYPRLVGAGHLAAHETDHRYYSMGSMERLPLTEAFFSRRPMLILDRDGVLNRRPPRAEYVRRPGGRRVDAGRRWRLSASWPGLDTALSSSRIRPELLVASCRMRISPQSSATCEQSWSARAWKIEQFYYCPHGWDDGCSCRKPRPGMLFQAQRDFHLDLTRTLFVGDDERDGQAAQAAGCRFVMVDEDHSLLDVARELVAAEVVR